MLKFLQKHNVFKMNDWMRLNNLPFSKEITNLYLAIRSLNLESNIFSTGLTSSSGRSLLCKHWPTKATEDIL